MEQLESRDAVDGAAGPAFWWGPDVFMSEAGENQRCPPVIDVTGGPRFLVFGPYLMLPAGVWRAVMSFELSPDAARRPMAVQFGSEPHYTTAEVEIGVPGPHTVEVVHPFAEPGEAQIRLWLKRAAFHGELRLIGAHVERTGDAPA